MAHIFVDVSNVASIRKGERGYAPWNDVILVCEAWLERHPGDNMVLVVDWGFHGYLQHNFADQFPSYARARDAKKVRFSRSGKTASLIEAPEKVAADEYILRRADRYKDRQIIAEDNYRPYRDDYAWLQGFELQLPVIEGEKVRFEPRYLRPLADAEIDFAEAVDEEKRHELEKTRAARRNRHQRRRAARSAPSVGARPANRAGMAPGRRGRTAPAAPTARSTGGPGLRKRSGVPVWLVPLLILASIGFSLLIARLF